MKAEVEVTEATHGPAAEAAARAALTRAAGDRVAGPVVIAWRASGAGRRVVTASAPARRHLRSVR